VVEPTPSKARGGGRSGRGGVVAPKVTTKKLQRVIDSDSDDADDLLI
jgi:hypothetical protein